ncbi:MAG: Phosphoglycerate mutase [Acidobacteria bacterium]|nr:Phosphoglycerate mutase [Acidobacteriota bacterium]
MKEVWLIRHAESTANTGAATYSPEVIPLTEKGQAQARAMAKQINRRPDLIVVSPFLRSKQTAAPLINRYPDVPTEEWQVQEFTYLSPDRCHNTTLTERKPLVAAYWSRNDPNYCDGPGAESFAALISRAQAAVAQIKKPEDKFAVIISHGQFIRAVIWLLLHELEEMKIETMAAFHCFLEAVSVPNAAIFKIGLTEQSELFFSGIIGSYLPANLLSL